MRVRVDGDKGEVWTLPDAGSAARRRIDEPAFGGKAASLGAALRAGLPVPPGAALGAAFVDRAAAGDAAAIETLLASTHVPDARLAVRSSAVGEDSAGRELRGAACDEAERQKAAAPGRRPRRSGQSARTESALAYRARKGLPPVAAHRRRGAGAHRAGRGRRPVHPQPDHRRGGAPDRSGVGARRGRRQRHRWCPIASGSIRGGRVLDVTAGEKDIKVWYGDEDGTVEVPVDAVAAAAAVPDAGALRRRCTTSRTAASACGDATSISSGRSTPAARIYLLQCRPITTGLPREAVSRVGPRRRRRSARRSPRSIPRWSRWRCRR